MEFMDKMLVAVRKKTGYDLDADELAEYLSDYANQSNKKLEASLGRLKKGEHGGDSVEDTAVIDEMEIVLAARRAWE